MDLAELIDRTLLADTLHTYCDRADRADLEGLLDLFTDDAVLDLGRTVGTGRVELRRLLSELMDRWATTSHHCGGTTVLRYDGTSATTVTYVHAFHDHPGRDETLHLWGRYEDELVQEGDRWRFRVHRLRVAGTHRTASSELPDRFVRYDREAPAT